MSKRVWNPEQKRALSAVMGHFLVSAGAGSGKTAVLTERIKRLVAGDPDEKIEKVCDLSDLLVLTFTNKAAGEMKNRVYDALNKAGKPDLAEEVERSDITTFDAFFLSLVKKYHEPLGLTADIAVTDEGILRTEREKLLDEILEEKAQEADSAFVAFVHDYAIKNVGEIKMMVNKVFETAVLSGDPIGFFRDSARQLYASNLIDWRYSQYIEGLRSFVRTSLDLLDEIHSPDLQELDQEAVDTVLLPLSNASEADFISTILSMEKHPFKNLSKKIEASEEEKTIRNVAKDVFKKRVFDELKALGTPEYAKKRHMSTKPTYELICSLAEELYARFQAFKKERGAYSFSDIAALADELLSNEEIANDLRNRYKFIMIDEYQDTSDLQQRFIDGIANNNTFCVGDIKQSIYGFRHADPEAFDEKSKDYLLHPTQGTLIPMNKNYRSRPEVIEAINDLFANCMTPTVGGVKYNHLQELEASNPVYNGTGGKQHGIEIIHFEKKDGLNDYEAEARIIAKDIAEKIESGYEVLDGKIGQMRPCEPKDFAILISKKTHFPEYGKVFNEIKIPTEIVMDNDFSSEGIVMLFRSLLSLILAESDIELRHCYASIARSFLIAEDDGVLKKKLEDGSFLNEPFMRSLRMKRNELIAGSSADAVEFLITEFPILDSLLNIGDVKSNYQKLNSFRNLARQMDRLGYSFPEFVQYFDDLETYDIKFSVESPSEADNAVRLMSIHASKGLEFPIIYCPTLFSSANLSDASNRFLLTESEVAVSIPHPFAEQETSSTFMWYLMHDEIRSDLLSEYMRLMYVQLTRAKEKIILVDRKPKDYLASYRMGEGNILYLRKDKDGNIKSSHRIMLSFQDFIYYAGRRFPERDAEAIKPLSPIKRELIPMEHLPDPEIRSLKGSYEPIIIERKRASKEMPERVDEGKLAYGTRLHRLLELIDWKTKDVSWIEDEKERKLIQRAVNLPLFDHLSGADIYGEYAFRDEEQGVDGSIDLLVVYPDHAEIIDYKTSNIDDDGYAKQLSVYATYVKRVFGLRTETYLLSITQGRFRKVE